MIGLALSGGGSRAMAFHLGCLRALNDLGLLDRIGALSTISGGSLIGAYFAYTPDRSFAEFDSDICQFLRKGFRGSIIKEFAKLQNLIRIGANISARAWDSFSSRVQNKEPAILQYPSTTDMFHKVLQRDVFPNLRMSSLRRGNIEVVIGTCELRMGTAFRFGSSRSGDWRHGDMVNWDVDVAFAAAASAAYPILLPAFDRKWKFRKNGTETDQRVLLTDGGVYDNLGLQVLEPDRDAHVSLHTFPCEYLIVCNAGHGQDVGNNIPHGFLPRVTRTFEVVHRRTQDLAIRRLFQLKQAGMIKGFVMPYLGQQDASLPWKQTDLIPRSEVIDYPTDLEPMSNHWIQKLAQRGEQLTRGLVEHYLAAAL
jgi:NTE family protein